MEVFSHQDLAVCQEGHEPCNMWWKSSSVDGKMTPGCSNFCQKMFIQTSQAWVKSARIWTHDSLNVLNTVKELKLHKKLNWKCVVILWSFICRQSNLTVFTIHILGKLQNVFLNIFSAQKVGINYQTVFLFSVLPNDARESNVPFFEN